MYFIALVVGEKGGKTGLTRYGETEVITTGSEIRHIAVVEY
jgi:hypothetical protein